MITSRSDSIQSVERCFAVLDAFPRLAPGTATVSALAHETGLARPVVRRLLITLEQLGLATVHGSRWELTGAILRFSHRYQASSAFVAVASRRAQWLSQELDMAITITRFYDLTALVVALVRFGPHQILRLEVGDTLPLHATAAGTLLLAWLDELPDLDLPALNSRTLTTPGALIERTQRCRVDGFAILDREWDETFINVGVPVLSPEGRAVGAVSTALPTWQWTLDRVRDEAVPRITNTCRDIADEMTLLTQSP